MVTEGHDFVAVGHALDVNLRVFVVVGSQEEVFVVVAYCAVFDNVEP